MTVKLEEKIEEKQVQMRMENMDSRLGSNDKADRCRTCQGIFFVSGGWTAEGFPCLCGPSSFGGTCKPGGYNTIYRSRVNNWWSVVYIAFWRNSQSARLLCQLPVPNPSSVVPVQEQFARLRTVLLRLRTVLMWYELGTEKPNIDILSMPSVMRSLPR